MQLKTPPGLRRETVDKIPQEAVKVTASTKVNEPTNQNDGIDQEAPWGRTVTGAPKVKPGRKPKPESVPPALKDQYIYRSGPTGLAPNTHVKLLARPYTPEALGVLVEIMRDTNAPTSARVSAATQVLDRAWGKPKETLEIDAPADGIRGALAGMSTEDLVAAIRLLRSPVIDVTPTVDAKKPGP